MNNSYFDGGLLELIVVKIACLLLTVFTFGIAYPWACCFAYSYEVNHTVVDGYRLHFDGKAIQLFGNWLKWLGLSIITFGIYSFWVGIAMRKWKTKHTHFLN